MKATWDDTSSNESENESENESMEQEVANMCFMAHNVEEDDLKGQRLYLLLLQMKTKDLQLTLPLGLSPSIMNSLLSVEICDQVFNLFRRIDASFDEESEEGSEEGDDEEVEADDDDDDDDADYN
ncbi:uncharacterized protein LOC131143858 [Malania oleifera]|uniref:uncharacterized protein LOC131143858 n=1 Tax=Malania oleifera TaxID=397392 RepID=UPI0025ADEB27|nr:uncharacterized protein LOC131143858 [Malania oleifera]